MLCSQLFFVLCFLLLSRCDQEISFNDVVISLEGTGMETAKVFTMNYDTDGTHELTVTANVFLKLYRTSSFLFGIIGEPRTKVSVVLYGSAITLEVGDEVFQTEETMSLRKWYKIMVSMKTETDSDQTTTSTINLFLDNYSDNNSVDYLATPKLLHTHTTVTTNGINPFEVTTTSPIKLSVFSNTTNIYNDIFGRVCCLSAISKYYSTDTLTKNIDISTIFGVGKDQYDHTKTFEPTTVTDNAHLIGSTSDIPPAAANYKYWPLNDLTTAQQSVSALSLVPSRHSYIKSQKTQAFAVEAGDFKKYAIQPTTVPADCELTSIPASITLMKRDESSSTNYSDIDPQPITGTPFTINFRFALTYSSVFPDSPELGFTCGSESGYTVALRKNNPPVATDRSVTIPKSGTYTIFLIGRELITQVGLGTLLNFYSYELDGQFVTAKVQTLPKDGKLFQIGGDPIDKKDTIVTDTQFRVVFKKDPTTEATESTQLLEAVFEDELGVSLTFKLTLDFVEFAELNSKSSFLYSFPGGPNAMYTATLPELSLFSDKDFRIFVNKKISHGTLYTKTSGTETFSKVTPTDWLTLYNQYATKAKASSTLKFCYGYDECSDDAFTAKQAEGFPDACTDMWGINPLAWTPDLSIEDEDHSLEFNFEMEMIVTNIYIYESWMRGSLKKVELFYITKDSDGKDKNEYFTVWEGVFDDTNSAEDGMSVACNIVAPPIFSTAQPLTAAGCRVSFYNRHPVTNRKLKIGIDTIRYSGLVPTDRGDIGVTDQVRYVPEDGFYGNDTMHILYIPTTRETNAVTQYPTLDTDITFYTTRVFPENHVDDVIDTFLQLTVDQSYVHEVQVSNLLIFVSLCFKELPESGKIVVNNEVLSNEFEIPCVQNNTFEYIPTCTTRTGNVQVKYYTVERNLMESNIVAHNISYTCATVSSSRSSSSEDANDSIISGIVLSIIFSLVSFLLFFGMGNNLAIT